MVKLEKNIWFKLIVILRKKYFGSINKSTYFNGTHNDQTSSIDYLLFLYEYSYYWRFGIPPFSSWYSSGNFLDMWHSWLCYSIDLYLVSLKDMLLHGDIWFGFIIKLIIIRKYGDNMNYAFKEVFTSFTNLNEFCRIL